MENKMKVRFWGTRGLVSSPSTARRIYGGNTPCIQVIYEDHVILIDTGFGVSNLGELLLKDIFIEKKILNIHIFYTHFHWDHIQGLPFFHPIYFSSSNINVYSPVAPSFMRDSLNLLFDGSYSPFSGIESMPSKIGIFQLSQSQSICGLKVDYCETDHIDANIKTYAYKLTIPSTKSSVCIITDHEARDSICNRKLIDFAFNSDILIHDGQYTEPEYDKCIGWGHSSITQALSNAKAMQAKQCLLTHHSPDRSDLELEDIYRQLSEHRDFSEVEILFAKEGVLYQTSK